MSQSSFGFEEWAAPFVDEADQGRRRPDFEALMGWFRSVYDDVGPVAREEVERRYLARQLGLAEDAVGLVSHDAAATSDLAATMSVDLFDGTVRITVDGNYTTPSMTEFERAEAIAEVADHLQEQVVEALWRAWPVCLRHNTGLYARVQDHEPVWWCPADDHVVAPIGALEPNRGHP